MQGKIVVFIEGGVLQGIVTETPGLEYMLVDYDDEKESGEIDRSFCDIEYNPEAVEKAINGTENDS